MMHREKRLSLLLLHTGSSLWNWGVRNPVLRCLLLRYLVKLTTIFGPTLTWPTHR